MGRGEFLPVTRPCAWTYFGVDTIPGMGLNIETPKITIMVETVLMQG
jgi:hypothetical protein